MSRASLLPLEKERLRASENQFIHFLNTLPQSSLVRSERYVVPDIDYRQLNHSAGGSNPVKQCTYYLTLRY
jgi:hypothetical protein